MLSDYGFIICNFDYGSGATEVSPGATITFGKKSRNNGRRFEKTGATYDECISFSLDICKNPDTHSPEEMEISRSEFEDIGRWLNRREFLRFMIIEDNEADKDSQTCYYNASFNITKLTINETLYGIRLNAETDSPFGYGQEISQTWSIKESCEKVLYDRSGDIGYIYPKVEITSGIDGNIVLENEMTGCKTIIKGCTVGEKIELSGDTLIITTDSTTHKIYNDFNYEFFTIGNDFTNTKNKISISLLYKDNNIPENSTPTVITISYMPTIKDVP